MQKRGAFQSDIDKRRLHAGQHSRDPPEIEVADQATQGSALDFEILDKALLHSCDACFVGAVIDQDFFVHDPSGLRPARRKSRRVS